MSNNKHLNVTRSSI